MRRSLLRLGTVILSPLERWCWFTRVSRNPFTALWLVCRIRITREGPHQILYNGYPVFFRARDEQALKEVLVDREYSFIDELDSSQSPARILDVGAHIGTFALWCASQGSAARVVCIEANPDTFRILRRNVEQWSYAGMELQIEQAAAGAEDDEELRMLEPVGSSMSARVDKSGSVQVSSLSFSSLVELCAPNGEVIDLAKIDIEGSEEALICSHPHALRRIRALVVELHPDLCDSPRVEKILRNTYSNVIEIVRSGSKKPLLYCRGNDGQARARVVSSPLRTRHGG